MCSYSPYVHGYLSLSYPSRDTLDGIGALLEALAAASLVVHTTLNYQMNRQFRVRTTHRNYD